MRPPDEISCERCGGPADVDWVDVHTWSDPAPIYVMGRSACRTLGCVDEFGSAAVLPPSVPGQLTRDDLVWLRCQRWLAAEYGRVVRQLAEGTAGW